MNNYLILVKHSLPTILENVPAREWHLSEEGHLRAEGLAKRLMLYQPDVLVSSTERKAMQTAERIGRRLQLPIHPFDNLHEHDRSKIAYLSKQEFAEAIRNFFLKPEQLILGSESADQAHERFSKAIQSVLQMFESRTTVVVSHGTVISLFVSHLTGISAYSIWQELGWPSFIVLNMQAKTLIAKGNLP